jgi:hypothetical protein
MTKIISKIISNSTSFPAIFSNIWEPVKSTVVAMLMQCTISVGVDFYKADFAPHVAAAVSFLLSPSFSRYLIPRSRLAAISLMTKGASI